MQTLRARYARLTFLVLAAVLTTFAMLPARQAEAATTCSSWKYNGCCGLRLSQYRQCCNDYGSCTLETRCTAAACYY